MTYEQSDLAKYTDPDAYVAPQPAHVRDVPGESVLVESGPRIVSADVHDRTIVALIKTRAEREKLHEELELARKIIGSGPFVVIKLSDLNVLTDAGAVEVRVKFGGGVTRHMLPAIVDLARQAVNGPERESVNPTCGDLSHDHSTSACLGPRPGPRECHWCLSGRDDCPRHAQPAEKPSTPIPHPMDSFPHTIPR